MPLPPHVQIAKTIKASTKAMTESQKKALGDAGLVMKASYLRAMQAKTFSKASAPTPTSVAGFTKHRKKAGQRLYARYTVRLNSDGRGGYHLSVWTPPPGGFLLEEGAKPHQVRGMSKLGFMLRYNRDESLANLPELKRRRALTRRGRIQHPGFKGRPFVATAVAAGAPTATRIVDQRIAKAVATAWERS